MKIRLTASSDWLKESNASTRFENVHLFIGRRHSGGSSGDYCDGGNLPHEAGGDQEATRRLPCQELDDRKVFKYAAGFNQVSNQT